MQLIKTVVQKSHTFRSLSWTERLRRSKKYAHRYFVLYPISSIWFFFGKMLLLGARFLEPFISIRTLRWRSSRIGHQIGDIEVFLRRRIVNPPQKKDWHLFVTENPSNRFLLKMIRRRVFVVESSFAFLAAQWLGVPLLEASIQPQSELKIGGPQLSFKKEELAEGKKLLAQMGIPGGASYICFHTRDGSYLRQREPGIDFSYHDFRDASIENTLLAVGKMTQKGLWALRMGAVVEKPLQTQNAQIIDYATRYRSDFGDIYLPAHCKFFLGTTTGITNIVNFFHRPLIWVNATPLAEAAWRHTDLFIPKKYQDTKSGRILPFREVIDRGLESFGLNSQFQKAGVRLIENTPEEILAVTQEMNDRLDGVWVSHPEDDALQEKYRSLWSKKHKVYGYPSRVGAEFLRNNLALLD